MRRGGPESRDEYVDNDTFADYREGQIEITIKDGVGGRTLWVNRNGVCICRVVGVEGDIHFDKPDNCTVTYERTHETIHEGAEW